MSVRKTATNSTTGTFALGPLNAQKSMDALHTSRIEDGTLSARVLWSVYTDTLTLTGKWQGSADNTTWRDWVGQNNAAHVVLQTSTGTGAKYIEAPRAIHGLPYVRFALVSGVASGTAGDTYTMNYNHVKRSRADDFRRL